MMRCLVHVASAALLAGALFGCAAPAPYQRPSIAVPAQWQSQGDAASAPMPVAIVWDRWWQAFGSDELNRLAGAAGADNHELAAAGHRVAQARSLLAATREPIRTARIAAAAAAAAASTRCTKSASQRRSTLT